MVPREPLRLTIYDDGVKTDETEAWRDAPIQWTGRHTVEFNGDASEPRASQHGLGADGVCDLLQTLREHEISWGKSGRHPGLCPPAVAEALAGRRTASRSTTQRLYLSPMTDVWSGPDLVDEGVTTPLIYTVKGLPVEDGAIIYGADNRWWCLRDKDARRGVYGSAEEALAALQAMVD